MNEEEKKSIEILKERKKYLLGLSKSSFYSCDRKLYKEHVEAIDTILNLIDKQQKEIERLKEESIGDTKFDKLLFSIRMLHFHNYVNDKQFAEMIKKLSNENKGE